MTMTEVEILDKECYEKCMEKVDDEEVCENECTHVIDVA